MNIPGPRRRKRGQPHGDGLARILAPSVLAICVCTLCLCGTTWAWFTATASSGATVIQAATYTVDVSAGENEPVKIAPESGTTTVTFTAAGEYTITLTPTGTAQNGYCKISYAEGDYYTGQLPSGSLHFTVNADANSELTVTPQWGSYSGTPNLSSDGTIGNATGTAGNTADMSAEQTTASAAPSYSLEESAASTPDTPADSKTAQPEGVTGGEQAPAPEDSNR